MPHTGEGDSGSSQADEDGGGEEAMRLRLLMRSLLRYWMLRLIEKILGDDIEPSEEKLMAEAYKKLMEAMK